MDFNNIISLLGGLSLFLYGMTMMSNGLEIAAGNRLKSILEKLTTNRFVGIGVGALITALIQSSSAMTVMVVGFVNAGLLQLENAVWLIMGANIGTTITGQLIALDISRFAPLLAFAGVSMIAFFKSQKLDAYGSILAGLGILFMGMSMMSSAMEPLRTMPEFVNLITKFQNPLIGILVGTIFTAIIQSSSASIGILQALAAGGVVTLPSAIFVLFGQNIGTCITAILAAIGVERNAKRTTIIHLAFNIIGTIIFVIITLTTPFEQWMMALTPDNVPAQIANTHTVFNLVTTIILIPFGHYMAKLAYFVLPVLPEKSNGLELKHLDFNIFNNEYRLGSSAIANTQLFREIQNMLEVVQQNVGNTFDLLKKFDEDKLAEIEQNENYIDFLNKEIIRFTTMTLSFEMPASGTQAIGLFLKVASDLERIGDHSINIAEHAQAIHDSNNSFSKEALAEIKEMNQYTQQILETLHIQDFAGFKDLLVKVDELENEIDDAHDRFSKAQMLRLKEKSCTIENSIQYSKILIDFERIGDHALNIAENFDEIQSTVQDLRMLHEMNQA
ncbi:MULTISPECIES: Na/Pi cotransporter family protein [unclassified Facklamia]|uniref:Na/Pi cotransporter family protein n=1 Tax=Aerococcaceae TaxID=186827 RepID=UPI0013B83F15|nr:MULTISPECIES: Na/Pi cotransporter family protein [unclassified Facklamia]NEW63691.1 Na/Pi cotransporter family protein [Facklamia sp. 252]NEW67162.1 Na/Pi cotransporter family protein [Facklamia sp. 253]QQD66297.1 Na/Pi cotransporter family protein [Aerococcaceae bacterium zg-252]